MWTQVADTGPTLRCAHRITFDSVRRRVVLFGGWDGSYKNDTWEWDGGGMDLGGRHWPESTLGTRHDI